MSNLTFNTYWKEATAILEESLEFETPRDQSLIPREKNAAYRKAISLYVRYIQTFKKVQLAYDQMLHPQKRILLKRVVLAVLGRLIELKQKMNEIQLTDYHNFVEMLLEFKLTPDSLVLPLPNFMVEDRPAEKDAIANQMKTLGAKMFACDEKIVAEHPLTVLDAIRIIQIHEKGRQGMLRAKYLRELKLSPGDVKDENINEKVILNSAALRIQKLYRGHVARREFQRLQDEDSIFLGMKLPAPKEESPSQKRDVNFARRKGIQKSYHSDYLESIISTKEKIKRVEGPEMKEDLLDKFRQYYLEFKRVNGTFPDFPEDEDFMRPDYKFGDKSRIVDVKEVDPKKKPEKADDAEETISFTLDGSLYTPVLKNSCKDYIEQWKEKDESANFSQKHDQEIIKKEKRAELEILVKEDVIILLKDELENLKLAIEKDKGKKGKKDAKKKGKKDKAGKKGKKDKDLTAHMTMEELVEELITNNILQQYNDVDFDQFQGSIDLMGASTEKCQTIQPTLGELKKIVMEYCALPLGFPVEADLPQVKIPKIMLFGSSGTGKTMLVNSIATACRANIFNLSPFNTGPSYLGKANVTKMIHMVFKVAKANEPSIIYIDGFEMIFAKKVPKTDTSDPKRIKKDLLKQIKMLGDESRVLVIGTSHKPWEGDVKAYPGLFDKQIFCPKPDYQSRYILWEYLIQKELEECRNVDYSLLTRLSTGLSAGSIEEAVKMTLTSTRLNSIRTKSVLTSEFTVHLANLLPQSSEEDELFADYLTKTPLSKKREALLNPEKAGEAEPKKDAKKK